MVPALDDGFERYVLFAHSCGYCRLGTDFVEHREADEIAAKMFAHFGGGEGFQKGCQNGEVETVANGANGDSLPNALFRISTGPIIKCI